MKRWGCWMMVVMVMALLPAELPGAPLQSRQAGALLGFRQADDLDAGGGVLLQGSLRWGQPWSPWAYGLQARTGWLRYGGGDYPFDVSMIPLEVAALGLFEVRERAWAYVSAGVGYYLFAMDHYAYEMDSGAPGFSVAGGWEQRVGDRFSVVGEVSYLWLEPEIAVGSISLPASMDGIGVKAGLSIRW